MAVLEVDAYTPQQVALRVDEAGVRKARLPRIATFMLGVAAGGFIGLGALYYTLVVSDASLGFAAARVLGGAVFSLGLILVVVAGAELFTGNNLLAMAWADGRIGTGELLANWLLVFTANAVGAMGLAGIVAASGYGAMNGGGVAMTAVRIAAAKTAMPLSTAFFNAVLCNLLVCLAVWMAMAGRSVTDRILAVILPISAFVAAGFEHSVANLYLIPLGLLLKDTAALTELPQLATLDWGGFARNLAVVTLGNIAGGSGMVALTYHLIYNRGLRRQDAAPVAANDERPAP